MGQVDILPVEEILFVKPANFRPESGRHREACAGGPWSTVPTATAHRCRGSSGAAVIEVQAGASKPRSAFAGEYPGRDQHIAIVCTANQCTHCSGIDTSVRIECEHHLCSVSDGLVSAGIRPAAISPVLVEK